MSVVVDPDSSKEGGEELSLYSAGGGGEKSVRACHEIEIAQYHLGVLFEGLGGRL
ncbi:hypothetical protein ABXJ56_02970 [Microbacterium chocolatum]|uniref:hypothetical protein n=1 Tax=Microbacterium aurantiacum TaxID=162393 RepID=UPI00338F3A54